MKNLELISQTRLDSLDPAGEWLEATTTAYVNTRDSVAQKNFIDLNQITKGSINRIQISTIHPSDSTLFIVDSVNIFFTDNNRSIQVGFLYDVPTNSTPKLLDANIEQYDEGDLGNLFRSDTVFIKTSFHLRTLVRSDSMKFQVDALYGLRNH
ncbi:hypothetical protein KMW28_08050 [Flammeovirga yaeyamensis]|uniref:Uncharacterized protein n=1 Tax=Flammeovirga yaeyamensis TaxID=367791 RepID=A0AAX1N8I4_9BACT|nr:MULTISPECIES: hypothetical protein [Flammeovirga]ANQ48998.2 hypothetical protein MY04_1624 [Flammeovirga sp. MY04]MBB3699081.1 hypothetical protein [Flammeovirga yaeyamensis]NMF36515.1 hypothetical protein [Flammeovirga yaeyamensis]QWG03527.1 hypothetical protein KMW28_08050 [Flammeovirga yaeyamensis]